MGTIRNVCLNILILLIVSQTWIDTFHKEKCPCGMSECKHSAINSVQEDTKTTKNRDKPTKKCMYYVQRSRYEKIDTHSIGIVVCL